MAKQRTNVSIRGPIHTKARPPKGGPNTIGAGIPGIGEFRISGCDSFSTKASLLAGKLLRLLLMELKRLDPKVAREAARSLNKGLAIGMERMKAGEKNVRVRAKDLK